MVKNKIFLNMHTVFAQDSVFQKNNSLKTEWGKNLMLVKYWPMKDLL